MPIQLVMYADRLEIVNPGGLYGRLTVDQLGQVQPDTRNPVLVMAMETLGRTENRYSGIPTIRYAMKSRSLPEPVFLNSRGEFKVVLYHGETASSAGALTGSDISGVSVRDDKGLLTFCRTPRSRAEIIEYLGIASGQYALRHYLDPLIQAGAIRMMLPDTPRSPKQQYVTVRL